MRSANKIYFLLLILCSILLYFLLYFIFYYLPLGASWMVQQVKNKPAIQETLENELNP